MSTTTFPVSGSFGGRKSQPTRRTAMVKPAVQVKTAPVATKRFGWINFMGDAMTTWATAGRLPIKG